MLSAAGAVAKTAPTESKHPYVLPALRQPFLKLGYKSLARTTVGADRAVRR
jgi:hypothetical protein